MPDQLSEESLAPSEEDTAFLPNGAKELDNLDEERKESFAIPNSVTTNPTEHKKNYGIETGQSIPGTYDNSEQYLSYSKYEKLFELRQKGSKAVSFSYFRDSFNYKDSNKTFKKIFQNDASGSKAMQLGMLQLSIDQYLFRWYMEMSVGINIGVSYNRGKGYFSSSSSEMSSTIFQLWTVPLDFSLSAEIPLLWSWFKGSVGMGPSMMALFQTRNDYSEKEDGKRKRQIGLGYFAELKFKISLSNLFRSHSFALYSNYQTSRLFLDFNGRMHHYSQFKDKDISISGTAIGAGLTFEFL